MCTVSSYGTLDLGGTIPAKKAIAVCAENEIDITTHRSRQFCLKAAEEADIILTMEYSHIHWIYEHFGESVANKAYLLSEYGAPDSCVKEIPDPIGCSQEFYREVFSMLRNEIERIAAFESAKARNKANDL